MSLDDGDREWAGTQQLPVPPTGAPRSPVAAALLNLTGLGLGYAYLGRWGRAALYVTGTALLVVVAFVTDAADRPWLWRVFAVVWVAWMAWDGWRLAGRTGPLTGRARVLPVAVGGLLVGAMVAGFLLYTAAGRRVHADGLAAQARADCASAITKYDTVTGPYELTLSPDVPAARVNRAQCVAFMAASHAQDKGAFADAVDRYRDFRRVYRGTVLVPFVHENLTRTYTDWATSRRAAGAYPEAIGVYRDLLAESGSDPGAAQVRGEIAATYFEQAAAAREDLVDGTTRVERARTAVDALLVIQREFGDTATAPMVPQAIVDTFTAANLDFAGQRYCQALPVLDYFVTLPDAGTAGVVGAANANRVHAMLECGLERFREPDYAAAITQLDRLVAAYPDSPQAPQARSAIIAAKVGVERTLPVPLPAPLGGDSPGDNAVTFYNDSPREARVLVAGPTAHEFTLPACPECPAEYQRPEDACPTFDGRPSFTLQLGTGTYYLLGTDPSDASIAKLSDLFIVTAGFDYTNCLHIGPDRPGRYDPYLPFDYRLPRIPDLLEIPEVRPR